MSSGQFQGGENGRPAGVVALTLPQDVLADQATLCSEEQVFLQSSRKSQPGFEERVMPRGGQQIYHEKGPAIRQYAATFRV